MAVAPDLTTFSNEYLRKTVKCGSFLCDNDMNHNNSFVPETPEAIAKVEQYNALGCQGHFGGAGYPDHPCMMSNEAAEALHIKGTQGPGIILTPQVEGYNYKDCNFFMRRKVCKPGASCTADIKPCKLKPWVWVIIAFGVYTLLSKK